MQSKTIASLLGLAIGDAVGATVEFLPRGRFRPVTDMLGGGKFRLEKGNGQMILQWHYVLRIV